jgi:hypothetical protein
MIQLIDTVDCDALHKSIVKPEALRRAVLVQDAGTKDELFALLMVDDRRAVLVSQGSMSLNAKGGSGMLKLQAFRNQIDKSADVRSKELRFCAPGTYKSKVLGSEFFDPQWFVAPTFPDLAERFAGWRAGRATW